MFKLGYLLGIKKFYKFRIDFLTKIGDIIVDFSGLNSHD